MKNSLNKTDFSTQVWWLDITEHAAYFDDYLQLLCEEEQAKTFRFYQQADQQRFAIVRAMLKTLLGQHLNIPAKSVVLTEQERGKPMVSGCYFNVSHSGERGLIAISPQCEVGVDVEQISKNVDWLPLAKRFFTDAETQQLLRLPPDQQRKGFFRIWVAKEAYIKGLGQGLFHALDSLAVDVLSPQLQFQFATPGFEDWQLTELAVPGEYCAAIATQGEQAPTLQWQQLMVGEYA